MMSKKKMRSINIILTIFLVFEIFCMISISFGIWFARTSVHETESHYQSSENKKRLTLCSVTSIRELSPEDALVWHTVPQVGENCHYFLCTLEVENTGNEPIDYLNLEAMNQNSDYLSCYSVDYYQDIRDADGNIEEEYNYSRMAFPEYSRSQHDVMLVLWEDELKEMEKLLFFERNYEASEEEVINEVICVWEDVLTSSPIQ